jgi:hypothetical protein
MQLTDEQKLQREQLNLIAVCNPYLLLMHIEEDTNYDAKLLARVFELAKARAVELLSGSTPSETREPLAWVRYRSDGGFEGPIMDTDERMCDARRSFWTPLYAAPQPYPTAVVLDDETRAVLRLCIVELSSWMRDHGQDLRSQDAVKRARALVAASPQPVEQTRALTDEACEAIRQFFGSQKTDDEIRALLIAARPASGETE